jgi:hypothetical protein
MNQPRPASLLAATPAPPTREPAGHRLIRLWIDLTLRAAAAAAHRTGEEDLFYDLQQQVEDSILERFSNHDALLAELWAWEATLIHTGGTPGRDCLACRRALLGPPDELPMLVLKDDKR